MDDKRHESQPVDILDYVDANITVDGHVFYDCEVYGPAVIIPGNGTIFQDNILPKATTPELWEAHFWRQPNSKKVAFGGIIVRNCLFERCQFFEIGFGGTEDNLAGFSDRP